MSLQFITQRGMCKKEKARRIPVKIADSLDEACKLFEAALNMFARKTTDVLQEKKVTHNVEN